MRIERSNNSKYYPQEYRSIYFHFGSNLPGLWHHPFPVLNIVLNAWLIPIFGFVAAGYTTLLCYVLYSFAHYYFMRKVCDQYLDGCRVYDPRLIIAIGAGLILLSLLIMVLYNTVIIRYVLLGALGILGILKRKEIIGLIGKMKQR